MFLRMVFILFKIRVKTFIIYYNNQITNLDEDFLNL